jgi:ABC-type branched-subunit amino acid transport system substrate-binding protein
VELNHIGIPAIGAALTATTLSSPGLFQVSPSNDQSVTALASYLRTRPDVETAVLAYDTNDDDYVRSLRTAFRTILEEPYVHGRIKGFIGSLGSHDATPAVFDDVKQNVCLTRADAVFYAGRDRDLPHLIDQLAHRGECGHDKPLVILTGSTGLNLDQGVESTMGNARITLISASSSDYNAWHANVDAPAGFDLFHQAFTRELPDDDLKDGYAIGHHDAVTVAVWAIRRFALQAAGRLPSGTDVLGQIINLNEVTHAVPAAGGTLTFDDASGGWPHGKKISITQLPDGQVRLPSFTTP